MKPIILPARAAAHPGKVREIAKLTGCDHWAVQYNARLAIREHSMERDMAVVEEFGRTDIHIVNEVVQYETPTDYVGQIVAAQAELADRPATGLYGFGLGRFSFDSLRRMQGACNFSYFLPTYFLRHRSLSDLGVNLDIEACKRLGVEIFAPYLSGQRQGGDQSLIEDSELKEYINYFQGCEYCVLWCDLNSINAIEGVVRAWNEVAQ